MNGGFFSRIIQAVSIFPGSLCNRGSQPINRLGQAACLARRHGDREQEVVELNSECLCGKNETKSKKV